MHIAFPILWKISVPVYRAEYFYSHLGSIIGSRNSIEIEEQALLAIAWARAVLPSRQEGEALIVSTALPVIKCSLLPSLVTFESNQIIHNLYGSTFSLWSKISLERSPFSKLMMVSTFMVETLNLGLSCFLGNIFTMSKSETESLLKTLPDELFDFMDGLGQMVIAGDGSSLASYRPYTVLVGQDLYSSTKNTICRSRFNFYLCSSSETLENKWNWPTSLRPKTAHATITITFITRRIFLDNDWPVRKKADVFQDLLLFRNRRSMAWLPFHLVVPEVGDTSSHSPSCINCLDAHLGKGI